MVSKIKLNLFALCMVVIGMPWPFSFNLPGTVPFSLSRSYPTVPGWRGCFHFFASLPLYLPKILGYTFPFGLVKHTCKHACMIEFFNKK